MKLDALKHQGKSSGQLGQKWSRDELSDTDESKINGLYGVNDTVILDDTVTNNNSIDNVTDENIITDDKTTTP